MNWGSVWKTMVGVACSTVLVVHAPPVIVDPIRTAITQMRVNNVPTTLSNVGSESFIDTVSSSVKKVLK